MNNLPEDKPLMVWFFTDDKPGHLSQLKGLESRLSAHVKIEVCWFSVSNKKINLFDTLLKLFTCKEEQSPDLVVGSGQRTHKYLVAAKRSYNCFSVVLMKPSLPLKLFDAAIIPEHDNPAIKNKILVTVGVLNNIVPRGVSAKGAVSNKRGLILIGGKSKHYRWDEEHVLQQIELIVTNSSDVDGWILGNSRRTPDSFLTLLKEKNIPNLKIVKYQNTDSSWLPKKMARSKRIWVTPDSVSMVYEAITSGSPTSILKLKPKKETKVVKGVHHLLKSKLLSQWPDVDADHQISVLWEADRAAIWLLDRLVKSSR